MKILLGDFNAKFGREDICKPTIWIESLHEINNDIGIRIVNLPLKIIIVESTLFLHSYIHTFVKKHLISVDGKTHSQIIS
jgi:hypothetical protein